MIAKDSRRSYERGCRNHVTISIAASQSETFAQMRKLLREDGYAFKRQTLRKIWERNASLPTSSLNFSREFNRDFGGEYVAQWKEFAEGN